MANEETQASKNPSLIPGALPQPKGKTSEPFEIKFDELPKFGNPGLPTIWIDNVTIVVRGTADCMEGATLRFYTMLPEAAIEVSRFQVSIKHLQKMIDVFARTIDHYPQRPESSPDEATPADEDQKPKS